MALVAFPPTPVYFLASCAKPEAFAQIAGMPGGPAGATASQILAEESDAAAAEALSDRIPTGSIIVQMDQGFVGHIVSRAARRFMSSRGYSQEANADKEIVEQAKRADTYITACGPSATNGGGKRITPGYALQDITPQVVDSIIVTSHDHADHAARPRGWPQGRAPWPM